MKWIKCFISSSQCWVVGPCYANLCCIQRSTVCVQNGPPFVAQIQEFPSQILGAILWTVLLSCNSCILYIDIYMLSSGSCQVPLEQISPRMKDTTSAKKHPEKNPPPRGKTRQQVPSALGSRFARYRWADQRMAVNARVTIPSTKRKKCREMGEGELGEDETQMNPQIPNGKQLAK